MNSRYLCPPSPRLKLLGDRLLFRAFRQGETMRIDVICKHTQAFVCLRVRRSACKVFVRYA
jgi:hypothetical protein